MKILHVIQELGCGGAQTLLADLLPALTEADPDSEISILVYRSLPDSHTERRLRADRRVRFISLDLPEKQLRSLSPSFRMMSEVRRADVVHAHLFPALYHVALASWISGTPALYTVHNCDDRRRAIPWLRPVERLIYSAYRRITAISGPARDSLLRWIGFSFADRISVIANGIDLSLFADCRCDPPHPSLLPMLFRLDEEQLRSIVRHTGPTEAGSLHPILMVSRFTKAKDQQTLIRAMHRLRDRQGLFVAFAGDGPTLPECRRLAEHLDIAGRVTFLGNRDDIPSLIAASEIGVQASRSEAFGIAPLEMMAAGLPVVVSDTGGLKDLASDDAAAIFPPGDDATLADIIAKILDDTVYRRDLSDHGRQRSQAFDIKDTARRLLDIYKSI